MTVLVAYGTTGGGTGEIAEWVAEQQRAAGLTVRVMPAAEVTDVSDYDALVLGSALYGYGWHLDVRRFVHRFAGRFADRPVWLFSSGPLDGSADAGPLPPVPHAYTALRDLPAREHVTFGGRMTDEAHGWLGQVANQEYILRAELPGLDPEKDVQISTLHGVLTVKAERREEETARHRTEFRYGSVQRSVRLPGNADESAIKATYRKGILEITVPLTEPQPAGKQIAISVE